MTTETAPPEASSPTLESYRLGPAANVVFKRVGFKPTGEEQAAILRSRKRRKAVSGGARAGKSLTASKDWLLHWIDDSDRCPAEMLRYWLVAADYDRTRAEFNYIGDDLRKLGLPVEQSKRVDPGAIEVRVKGEREPRILIETKSSKDPRTLAMFAPHGIIECEASQIDLESHLRCIERLVEKRGWLFASGTMEGSLGWWPGLVAGWAFGNKDEHSFVLPTTSNRVLFPLGENDPELQALKRNSSDEFYMERIMGIASPPKGLVFTEFRPDVHIRDIPYNPDLPIYIWEDPGYGHAHAILLAQKAPGGQVRIIHEMYERGITTEDMIDVLMGKIFWKNPNKKLVIDPNYANQHHGSRSIAEIWLAKTGLVAQGTKTSIGAGTERIKTFLKVNALTGEPGIVFTPQAKGILSEFGAYPNPFDGQTRVYRWKVDREGNVLGDDPDDKNNDAIKALSYGLVEEFGLVTAPQSGYALMRRYSGSQRAELQPAVAGRAGFRRY